MFFFSFARAFPNRKKLFMSVYERNDSHVHNTCYPYSHAFSPNKANYKVNYRYSMLLCGIVCANMIVCYYVVLYKTYMNIRHIVCEIFIYLFIFSSAEKIFYSVNYMKNIFSFTFIVKLEYNNIKILIILEIVNYTYILLFVNDYAFVYVSKYLNNYRTAL